MKHATKPLKQEPYKWLVGKAKFLVPAMLVFGLPIAYIIKKHMDWKPNPDSKKRMLIHHLTFWPLFFLGIGVGHNARKTYKFSLLKTGGWLAAGMGMMIAGFEGGDRLARYIVPKAAKPSQPQPIYPQLPFTMYSSTQPLRTASLNAAAAPTRTTIPYPMRSYSTFPSPGLTRTY